MPKGQAAIAAEDGYVQIFEYMAMELLGPRIAEQKTDGRCWCDGEDRDWGRGSSSA